MKTNDYFELGKTPVILKKLGAKDLPVIMLQEVVVKMTGGKHNISSDEIKKIPEQLNNPIMVFDSATVKNAFVLVTELSNKSGDPVVIALHINRKQDRLSVNRVASVYGKDNIAHFIETQVELGNLKYFDKEKCQQWSTSRGLQLPKLVQSITDNHSILQKNDFVNASNEKKSKDLSSTTNNEYMRAVESGDLETPQTTVYNVGKIKKDSLPNGKIKTIFSGSKPDSSSSDISISKDGGNVNTSNEKKSRDLSGESIIRSDDEIKVSKDELKAQMRQQIIVVVDMGKSNSSPAPSLPCQSPLL